MKRLIFLVFVCLTACQTSSPDRQAQIVRVNVPVNVSCVPDDFPALGALPSDSDLKQASDAAARYALLAEHYVASNSRIKLDEAVIAACRKP